MPLVFLPVLFYPPLQLTDVVPSTLRVSLFIFLVAWLFLKTRKLSQKDLIIFFVLMLLLCLVITVNYFDAAGLRTASSTTLTLIFAWISFRAVRANEKVRSALIYFYFVVFLIVPIFSLLSLAYYFLWGEVNLLNIDPGGHGSYIYTPFGTLVSKDFWGVWIAYRSFSYFYEPVLLAFFYAVNIFVLVPLLREKKYKTKLFLWVNWLGGIFTFSYLFMVLCGYFIFLEKINLSPKKILLFVTGSIMVVALIFHFDIFSASSLGERVVRIQGFIDAMEKSNIVQLFFGHGFTQDTGFNMGFASGVLTSIYEIGLIGLVISLVFLLIVINGNYGALPVYLIADLIFEPLKMPLFWVLVILLSAIGKYGFDQYQRKTE